MIVIKQKEKFVIGTGIYMWELSNGKPQMRHLGMISPLPKDTPKKKKRVKKATNGNN